MDRMLEQLWSMQDAEYKQFHSKLMPTVSPDVIIGVRTPILRKFSKEIAKESTTVENIMKQLPHRYYEENNLHAFLIEQITDFGRCIEALNQFLPYVDNWATCDMMVPKVLKNDLKKLWDWIQIWIASGETYTMRFGIDMLMKFYLEDEFRISQAELVASIRSNEYYVNMAVAWYFATALAKQYEEILPFLTEQRLDLWTHNKTIQKAIESYRITPEQKAYLRSLKRK